MCTSIIRTRIRARATLRISGTSYIGDAGIGATSVSGAVLIRGAARSAASSPGAALIYRTTCCSAYGSGTDIFGTPRNTLGVSGASRRCTDCGGAEVSRAIIADKGRSSAGICATCPDRNRRCAYGNDQNSR